MRRVVIANPSSAGGATGRRRQVVERWSREILEAPVRWTDAPGAGRRMAAQAREEGFDVVVVVGGDGTISEVVDGLVGAGGGAFAVVPSGTGGDLARTLQLPQDMRRAMRAAREGGAYPVDVIRLHAVGHDGQPFVRHGINVSGVGMAGDVVARVNQGQKRLGGTVTFAMATLQSLWAWRPVKVSATWVEPDGGAGAWEGRLTNAFVGNGRFCGGGMWVTPAAKMDDGLLDVVLVPEQPLFDLVRRTPALYRGSLGAMPGVVSFRASEVRLESMEDRLLPVDLDGEAVGVGPVRLEAIHGCVQLVARRVSGNNAAYGVDHPNDLR